MVYYWKKIGILTSKWIPNSGKIQKQKYRFLMIAEKYSSSPMWSIFQFINDIKKILQNLSLKSTISLRVEQTKLARYTLRWLVVVAYQIHSEIFVLAPSLSLAHHLSHFKEPGTPKNRDLWDDWDMGLYQATFSEGKPLPLYKLGSMRSLHREASLWTLQAESRFSSSLETGQ